MIHEETLTKYPAYKLTKRRCIVCGKRLKRYQGKFCSKECFHKYHYMQSDVPTKKYPIKNICKVCGKVFYSRSKMDLCSTECRKKFLAEHHKRYKNNEKLPKTREERFIADRIEKIKATITNKEARDFAIKQLVKRHGL